MTVYQAYTSVIATAAVNAGQFVPPFRRGRMTWIKPSFLWMMYRSGWATKPGQEHVLAISLSRDGFEWALAHSSLSHHDPAVYETHDDWAARKLATPVRIQWDPERSLTLAPLRHRTIQVGLSGQAAHKYVDQWTVRITDITAVVHRMRDLVAAGDLDGAAALLPDERTYPIAADLAVQIGASS